MKLREYLEQFKDLDPELEVYGLDDNDYDCLETKTKYYIYAYVQELGDHYPEFRYDHSNKFNQKVLVVS